LKYCFQAEKFGNSFVLETYISEEVKKNITQAVSFYILFTCCPYWCALLSHFLNHR